MSESIDDLPEPAQKALTGVREIFKDLRGRDVPDLALLVAEARKTYETIMRDGFCGGKGPIAQGTDVVQHEVDRRLSELLGLPMITTPGDPYGVCFVEGDRQFKNQAWRHSRKGRTYGILTPIPGKRCVYKKTR